MNTTLRVGLPAFQLAAARPSTRISHTPVQDTFTRSAAPIRFSADPAEQEILKRYKKAQQAARLAGAIAMQYYNGKDMDVQFKSPGDIVTLADKQGDEAIVGLLKAHFPGDAFFTEESSDSSATLNLATGWVIDPLDGTRNFTHKTGPFGVSIAYLKDGKPVVGVVYDPRTKEMFRAMAGKGAFLNNRPIQVNQDAEMQKTTIVDTFFPPPPAFFKVPSTYRRIGSTAIDMAYVASGRLAAASEKKLKAWDVAAGVLLIQEAGGKVTDLQGKALDLTRNPIEYLGSNLKIHDKILPLLQG